MVIKILAINEIHNLDCLEGLKQLDNNSVHCCVTSPPYWGLRDYGVEGQIALEDTPEEYVENLVAILREVKRVLRDDGTLWLNLGDSYAGSWGSMSHDLKGKAKRAGTNARPPTSYKQQSLKPKDLVGIPWMVAFALRADGWYLRQDIIWHKPNAMPESVKDRCTKAHEYIFLFAKSEKYYFDANAIREENKDKYNGKRGTTKTRKKMQSAMRDMSDKDQMQKYSTQGRNKRTVWTIPTKPFKEAHFAVFPPDLIKPCILAGTSPRACEICGAPWKRVVKVESGQGEGKPYDSKRPDGLVFRGRNRPSKRTELGWYPTCSCKNEGTGRCIVLDPFMGSGTTGMVAAMHQRNFIGFELNQEYCEMAEKRIEPYLMQQPIFELL